MPHQNKPNQQWKFVSDGQGNYTICNVGANGGILEIPDFANAKVGTQCVIGPNSNTIN